MFNSHHVSDIGKVLLQAQEDIAALREQIGEQQQEDGASGTVNAEALEKVLTRAEADLRAKAIAKCSDTNSVKTPLNWKAGAA